MEEETRYFYQPNLTTTIISWCWTFLIFIAGLVVWLEITHFQWITALFCNASRNFSPNRCNYPN